MSSVLARYHLYPTGWLLCPFAIERNGNKGSPDEVPQPLPPYSQALAPCPQQSQCTKAADLHAALPDRTHPAPRFQPVTCKQPARRAVGWAHTQKWLPPARPAPFSAFARLKRWAAAPGRPLTAPRPTRPRGTGRGPRRGSVQGGLPRGRGRCRPPGRCPPARRGRGAHPASRMTLLSPQSQAPPAWLRNML